MARYNSFTSEEISVELAAVNAAYQGFKAKGLKLNMARGKPSAEQLDLSRPMLEVLGEEANLTSSDGTDCANYGGLSGIPEAKQLLARLLNDDPENIIAGGSSSLTLMFDAIARLWTFGTEGNAPWGTLERVKWLCPSPGYDRHFAICETFGMELIPVPLTDEGPDMDMMEQLIAVDPSIKGIWCVPQYSNPTGIVYSSQVVNRLASMACAAPDFRIFWDNAYSVHHLYPQHPVQGCRHRCRMRRCRQSQSLFEVRLHVENHFPRRRHLRPGRQPLQHSGGSEGDGHPNGGTRQAEPTASRAVPLHRRGASKPHGLPWQTVGPQVPTGGPQVVRGTERHGGVQLVFASRRLLHFL